MIMIDTVIHISVMLLMPPLLQGVIIKTKARFAGRVGAPVLQPYFDLVKLLRKQMVLSRTTTWMFLAGPAVSLVATLGAGLLTPLGGAVAPLHFTGDIVLFVYLLALGRFFTSTAALDTGSSFEGMGAARDITFACLAEPAVLLGLLALVKITGSFEFSGLLGARVLDGWVTAAPTMVMLVSGLFIVALSENCRIPFDDPNTHLELTMIHEVMVLDHSGPALAVIEYGAALKLLLFGGVIARIAAPVATGTPLLSWGILVAAVTAFAVAIGIVESVMARLRLVQVPNLLIGAGVLTGFGFVLLLMGGGR
jgi:formate hydrogenlyase subunit 4